MGADDVGFTRSDNGGWVADVGALRLPPLGSRGNRETMWRGRQAQGPRVLSPPPIVATGKPNIICAQSHSPSITRCTNNRCIW
ncbi:hypothetical protein [Reticulibacter mediterranei]|uniref:hypothetical protein n=1 Tax=Reticulibacter mediterranei TaxID=2778369 RepID=UPI001C6940B4|nr:hypothetical protein [Reticulibacter mediterranei]